MENKAKHPVRKKLSIKPKAWSHQNEIKISTGKSIKIVFADNSVVIGTLLEADQFTIKVKVTKGDATMARYVSAGETITLSKHSITFYAFITQTTGQD